MIAERGMRTSLTPIFDKFFLSGAHAVFEPRSPSLRDLLLPLLQLVSESDCGPIRWDTGAREAICFFCRDLSFSAQSGRNHESKLAYSLDYTAMSPEES